jgi:amidase
MTSRGRRRAVLTAKYRILGTLIVIAVGAGCRSEPTRDPAGEPAAPSLDVVELSASEARDRMAAGALTARALTAAYLARIAAIDDAGPALNAVIELNPDALADADALDAERTAGTVRGPLHGIPVLLKDNIDAAGMVNSAGSLALDHHRPKQDAFLVARLREAGAVILGKANLSEWANLRSTRSTSGWSSRGGQTRNPYVLDRNPCGSSSGSAVAVAASLAAVAVGTETDGSIICPASANGIVGLKPTVGLVSRAGIIPIAISQDTAGPMGRTVADVALLLNGLVGIDDTDPSGPAARGRIAGDYTTFLDRNALRGRRFGVLRQAMGYHPGVDDATERALEAMRKAGADVVDVKMPTYDQWREDEVELLLYEFKDGLNRYLETSGTPIRSLEALIEWNREHADTVMPFFGQELFEQAQRKGPLTDAAYLKARDATRRLGRNGLLAVFETYKVDAIVAPSLSPAWMTDPVLGDHFVDAGYSAAAVAGTPSLTVPVGESRGLPLGLTLMGRAYSEGELIGFASAIEQALMARMPPTFRATIMDSTAASLR